MMAGSAPDAARAAAGRIVLLGLAVTGLVQVGDLVSRHVQAANPITSTVLIIAFAGAVIAFGVAVRSLAQSDRSTVRQALRLLGATLETMLSRLDTIGDPVSHGRFVVWSLGGAMGGGVIAWGLLFWIPPSWVPLSTDGLLILLITLAGVVLFERLRSDLLSNQLGRLIAYMLPLIGVLMFVRPLVAVFWAEDWSIPTLGGLLPDNDAAGHFAAGLELLYESTINSWNQRRPINAPLNMIRTWMSTGDMQVYFFLVAISTAGAVFLGAREIVRYGGIVAACTFTVLCAYYFATFGTTTLSEINGFLLGLIGFAILMRAAATGSTALFGLAIAFLTLGLMARAGTLLAIPALLFAGLFAFGARRGDALRALFFGLVGLAIGVAMPAAAAALWADGAGAPQANFAHTFYGMVVGGKGWEQIYIDHPDIFQKGGGDSPVVIQAIMEKSFSTLAESPMLFVGFYVRELQRSINFLTELVPPAMIFAVFVSPALHVGLLWVIWSSRRDHVSRLFIAMMIGILLSSPFLMQDGGRRVFAATAPIVFAFTSFGLAFIVRLATSYLWPRVDVTQHRSAVAPVPVRASRWIAAAATGMVAIALAPLLILAMTPRVSVVDTGCLAGHYAVVFIPNVTGPVIHVLPEDVLRRTWLPDARISDVRGADLGAAEISQRLHGVDAPYTLVRTYNLAWRVQSIPPLSDVVVVGDSPLIRDTKPVRACVPRGPSGDLPPGHMFVVPAEMLSPFALPG